MAWPLRGQGAIRAPVLNCRSVSLLTYRFEGNSVLPPRCPLEIYIREHMKSEC